MLVLTMNTLSCLNLRCLLVGACVAYPHIRWFTIQPDAQGSYGIIENLVHKD
jgi:hypothetical protein